MGNYKPNFEIKDGRVWLVKYEKDWNCLFRKTKSLSIRCEDLERASIVEIHLPDGQVVYASKRIIKSHGSVMTFDNAEGVPEKKYYYPLRLWSLVPPPRIEPEQERL